MNLKGIVLKALGVDAATIAMHNYQKKFSKYSFIDGKCESLEQYEASIIRLYHTIEKGLSYENFRAGFGEANVKLLIQTLKEYSNKYNHDSFAYKTALSCLNKYIDKNTKFGFVNEELFAEIKSLPGDANDLGGMVEFNPLSVDELKQLDYESFVKNRKSIRHFSDTPVDVKRIVRAVEIAQHTPSACNRQGWQARIISDKKAVEKLLQNQNGNNGFGQEIDKLLIVTADIRCFQRGREVFQAYIDGGMYAQSILNSLHYEGIGSVPLSAALTKVQEANVRQILKMDDAEVLILFIGVGNYPEHCQTTRSERMPANIEII